MQSTAPSSALDRRGQAAWLGVLPLLLYLLLTGAGASNGVYLTPFRVVSLTLLVLVCVVWAIGAWRVPGARPSSALSIALGVACVGLVVATVMSERSRLGWEFTAYAVLLSGLYLLVVRLLTNPGLERRIAVVTAVCAGVVGAGYLAAVGMLWVEWWGLVGRLAVPPTRPAYEALMYGAPGILTAFMACAGAASLAMLWPMGRGARILGIAVAGLAAVVVVVAAARSGWAALGIGVLVTAAAALATGQRIRLPARRRTRLGLLSALAVIAVAAITLAPAMLRRLSTGGGEELRATLSTVSLRIFADHPLAGSGPGTWVTYRAGYTMAGETDYYIPHAHNMPLQLLAETGLVGVVAAAVVVAAVLRLVVPALRRRDAAHRARALGVVFVGTYLLVHQLFDFFMDMPAVLFAAVLPLAMLDALRSRRMTDGLPAPRRTGVAVPLAGATVALILLIAVEGPALAGDEAAAVFGGDPGAAARFADDASARDPSLPPYRWTRGLAADALGDVAFAETELRTVAEHDGLPQAWLNVAALALERGDAATARQALDAALRLGTQQPAVTVPAVQLLVELEDPDRAADNAAAAFLVAPTLADDPWWGTAPGLADARAAGVEIAVRSGDPAAWRVAAIAGNEGLARDLAAAQDPETAASAQLILDAWFGGADARQALEAAAVANPLGGLAGWAARVAARDGDLASADRYRRWASIGYGTSGGDFGYDVVVTDAPVPGVEVPGPNAAFHFRYAYRRTVPFVLLVEGLPRLTLH